MKLIVAIVKDIDADNVTSTLTAANFRVTTIASTSGFIRRGLNTMLCGVEDDQVTKAIEVIRGCYPPAETTEEKRCTIFVLNVGEYIHF
ncbi:MAG: hypothetical protein GYA58_15310 [Anaerolineaceae bacterium]|jgi:uncharacterized protein YaaQ|nr:hypothetical protein [Anaerolineaceae bacterium]NMC86644.1 hypothetical protein [Anaerolineaceae bacterium]